MEKTYPCYGATGGIDYSHLPLFTELRPYLEKARQATGLRDTWGLPILESDPGKNFGITSQKIVRRAGLKTWPKPL